MDFIINLVNAVQGNLVNVFLGVIGIVILIKITSKIVKTIITILLMLLLIKLFYDMGIITLMFSI